MHFWAEGIEKESAKIIAQGALDDPNPVATLQEAFENTTEATKIHDWQGTTTACGAQLHFKKDADSSNYSPRLYVTNLGDSQVMVIRPSTSEVIYKTTEQWHWFDCPRQLGTNSPDVPQENAVTDAVDLKVGDVVVAMSDGVIDNLWEHEIVTCIINSIEAWEKSPEEGKEKDHSGGRNGGMEIAAQDLVAAAKKVAVDPFAESPYMEHAIDEGLASEGGKSHTNRNK